MAEIWQLAADSDLHWRCWDGEWVVYNDASGDTHLLDSLAVIALKALAEGPAEADALCRNLAQSMDLAADDRLAGTVGDMLRELGRLGLVDRSPDR
jgi:PqqD family protein of HPr-rel-A system